MSSSLKRNLLGMLLPAILLLAATSCRHLTNADTPKFDSDYQVVIMTNGQVLIGKIDSLNTDYPVLRDVYSVQVVPTGDSNNPQKTMLVSRTREAHKPAFTVLQGHNILIIEPITKGSRMAELVQEEKSNAAQQAK